MSDPLAYDLRDIVAGYPGAEDVLRGLSLQLRTGELVGVVGPNGCGKSTLLRAMTGLVPLRSGQVRVDGKQLGELSRREHARRVAVVPQSAASRFAFTVEEVVEMGRHPHMTGLHSITCDDRTAIDKAMHALELESLRERPINTLSGGEWQRVVLARAMAQETRILLLDEPTTNLDLSHQIAICGNLRALAAEQGHAVLCVLHDLHLAAEYCHRLIVMHEGQVEAMGTPEEVLTPQILRTVYNMEVQVERNPVSGRPLVLMVTHRTEGPRP